MTARDQIEGPPAAPDLTPSLPAFLHSFTRIGLLSFGGPAAQISVMHDELVDRRGWLREEQFLGALSFCMLLPGPEAMQLATYAGWRLHGVPGGLLAGLLFVGPGALVIFGLAAAYATYADLGWVQAAFLGVKAAVVAIVLRALWGLSRKALRGPVHVGLATLAFIAMYALSLPFPMIILGAALVGAVCAATPEAEPRVAHPGHRHLLRTVPVWAGLWAAPVAVAYLAGATFLVDIGLFFSQLAVVTFGGAYAVLAYMTQTVVETQGWISTEQMIDALGLAETTPGPLILVTQFVGLLAGFLEGGPRLALMAGTLTLWVTFVPCFLWIFAGAPYVEWLLAKPRLKGALAGISAAVVGVILSLALWFSLHVLFGTVYAAPWGAWPVWSTLSPVAAGLTLAATVMLLALRWPIMVTLGLSAGISLAMGIPS